MNNPALYFLAMAMKIAAGIILWSIIGPGAVAALFLWDFSRNLERIERKKESDN